MMGCFEPCFEDLLFLRAHIRVWVVSVSRILEKEDRSFLSIAERNRAARFRYAGDEKRYCASRLLLREILGDHLGLDPAAVRFREEGGGKPFVDLPPGTPPVFFSLSRSGDYCAVALSDTLDVGVDIERVKGSFDWKPVAKAWLSEKENRALCNLGDRGSGVEAFFRLWCAREAAAKALGKGLALDSRSGGSLEGLLRGGPVMVFFGREKIEVSETAAPQGYRLALAAVIREMGEVPVQAGDISPLPA